jgi:hypothetical protein
MSPTRKTVTMTQPQNGYSTYSEINATHEHEHEPSKFCENEEKKDQTVLAKVVVSFAPC